MIGRGSSPARSSLFVSSAGCCKHVTSVRCLHCDIWYSGRGQGARPRPLSLYQLKHLSTVPMGAGRHLGFYRKWIFTIPRPRDPECISVSNFITTGQCDAEIFNQFSPPAFRGGEILYRLFLRVGEATTSGKFSRIRGRPH